MANDERARAIVNATFPGLADKTDEERRELINQVGKDVASEFKSTAIAYMIIGGIASFLCGGAYSVTLHPSFLILSVLALILVAARVRSVWRSGIRTELHRRYGPSSVEPQ
jgi:hypothetical protein